MGNGENLDVVQPEVSNESETADNAATTEQPHEPQTMHDALFGDEAKPNADESAQNSAHPEAHGDDVSKDAPKDESADDPDEDHTPPEGLSQKANERFQRLANENKAYREFGTPEQVQAMRTDVDTLNEFRSRIADSQMNQQELEGVFEYTKALKSGDFATVGKFLQEQVYQYEMLSGQRLNVDPLGAYPDLKQHADGMVDDSVLLEAARARYMQELQQQQQAMSQQQAQSVQMQEHQEKQIRQQAVDDLAAWANEVSRTDILWNERAPKINEFIQNELKDLLPNQWKPAVKAFYTALSQSQSAPVQRSPNALRPNNLGTASGNKTPANMHEAMWG